MLGFGLKPKDEVEHNKKCRELTDTGGRRSRGVVAAAAHVLAVGVNRLLGDSIVIIGRATNVIFFILIEIKGGWAGDTFSKVLAKIEVLSDVNMMMVMVGLFLFVEAFFHARPPPNSAEAALRNAPSPAQHLHPSAKRLGQTGFSRRRWSRFRGTFQVRSIYHAISLARVASWKRSLIARSFRI